MAKIEQATIAEGIAMVRLETGVYKRQRLAFVNLWVICHIQPFGSYLDDPLSLFMEKHLVPSAPA